ncbi:transposase [Bacteroides stercoris]|uniref:transposase n=1 Tax=Bacteroides stercoris TaxID=46506 RepID=UPI001920DFDA
MALDRVDVWFQDEARFGQQNTTSKIWAKKGTRPRVVKQQQFLSTHIFGAVCPATVQTEAIIASYLSKGIMRQHLRSFRMRRHVDGTQWSLLIAQAGIWVMLMKGLKMCR